MSDHSTLPWRAAKGGYIMAPDEDHEVQVGKIGDFYDKEIAPYNKGRWQADVDLIIKAVNGYAELEAEVARLRAIVRVNGLRWGHSHAEIDTLLAGTHEDREPRTAAGSLD